MKTFRAFQDRSELMLLPPSIRDWVPADHEVHFIADAVAHLDLGAILESYDDPRGNPPYHPRVMVAILVYAYARGVRGSRRIERLCYENVAMRVLAGNCQPDHWTISEFRRRHLKALGELFTQTVLLARQAGLVKMGHLCVDGTKIKANASKHSAMSYGHMREERARLEAEIRRELVAAIAEDDREDAGLGSRRGDELPPELVKPAARLAAIKKAMAALEAEAAARSKEAAPAEAVDAAAASGPSSKKKRRDRAGPPPGGATLPLLPDQGASAAAPPAPDQPAPGGAQTGSPDPAGQSRPAPAPTVPDKAQYNFTDPESRIMRTSSKAFDQCYNAQAAVDSPSQIIVAADLTNQAADAPHLRPVIDQAMANTGWVPSEVSADAGYFKAQSIEELLRLEIDEVLIPPEKIRHSEWRAQTPPRGRPPAHMDTKARMRRKLRTKNGRARYKLRQETVEPVFGQIKWNRGLLQFLLRGLLAARASWRFECAVHNLLKMRTAGVLA